MFNTLLLTLAQATPILPTDDVPEAPPSSAAPQRPMNFSDFQHGISQWNSGQTDNTLRNGMLVLVALVAVALLIVHLRQRWRAKQSPDSEKSLARELARHIPFPFGARLLLGWVARSTGVHPATLLISSHAFQAGVETWAAQPTFSLLRRWGKTRLIRLQPLLFARGENVVSPMSPLS